jgi:hypothetical protein
MCLYYSHANGQIVNDGVRYLSNGVEQIMQEVHGRARLEICHIGDGFVPPESADRPQEPQPYLTRYRRRYRLVQGGNVRGKRPSI